ncbi:MAG: heavy-metal-associated domain-containing protein [Acidobacteria bacterium]|nr:heavy-metal-associated domain-containing protein [Acidobacteriota bacterium]
MNEKLVVVGSAVTAFVASLCCLGPLLLGGIGLGVAFSATFESLRPYFLGATALLLALGFYFAYRKPQTAEACADNACPPRTSVTRKYGKPFLWLATVAVLALALFPVYGARFVPTAQRPTTSPTSADEVQLASVALKVSGMSCEACAVSVHAALGKLPGVAEAHVDFAGGAAEVRYDPTRVNPEQLVEAVNSTGFKASL